MIYFDNAATTPVSKEVLDAMLPYLTEQYGNPSSMYSLGFEAKRAIDNAREIIAAAIGADPDEIYFTSGGTESNNWALNSLYNLSGQNIIISNIEHHSIQYSAKNLQMKHNTSVAVVRADNAGYINYHDIERKIRYDTSLCSIMTINNEIGTIQDIYNIGSVCHKNDVFFHTDAVQAFGHKKIDVKQNHIDMLSASGHKLHGPKGVGFLYISKELTGRYKLVHPYILGGQQERGLRASTENVAGIVGLGKATEIAMRDYSKNKELYKELFTRLLAGVEQIPGSHMNAAGDYRYFNVRFDNVRAEELMGLLDTQGICVSAGSACASQSGEPSHVLKAIGCSNDEANSSIRISFGDQNTIEEVDEFLKYLKMDIELLREKNAS